MRWTQHDTRLIDLGGGAWHTGHLNDVLIQPGGLFLASETGNVWEVPSRGSLRVLTDLEAPNLTCLAQGPDGPDHVFAGGNAFVLSAGVVDPMWAFPAPAVVATAADRADVFAVAADHA